MAKKKMDAAKKKKIKIAVLASVGGLALIGGGVCIGYFGKETIKYFFTRERDAAIDTIDSENKIEEYLGDVVEDKQRKWEYLGSTEEKLDDEKVAEEYKGKKICAHTFLIGRVSNVPFFSSGWTKFTYQNIGMKISYSQMTTESVSTSLSTTNERVQSSSWSKSSKLQNTFKTSVEGGWGPVKASAENTLDYTMTNESSGSTMTRYVSNNSQTNTSIETLQKTADYSIQLNSNNGFKKNKYYRLSLEQTASLYLVIYEDNTKKNDDTRKKPDPEHGLDSVWHKCYGISSFLDNPSDYTMVVEESDDPNLDPVKPEEEKFDKEIYDECANWIDKQREAEAIKEDSSEFKWPYAEGGEAAEQQRKDNLNRYFNGHPRIQSDIYKRSTEYRITDAGRHKNPADTISFPTLFASMYAPTFQELFNTTGDGGYGYTSIDLEFEFQARQYDRGDNHVYLVNNPNEKSVIKEWCEDYDTKSWTRKHFTYSGLSAEDIKTTMGEDRDGFIMLMYDGSGVSSDDWGIRNLMVRVTIY